VLSRSLWFTIVENLGLDLKAMLYEAIFLAACNATNAALQVARKNSRITPHFATAILLRCELQEK